MSKNHSQILCSIRNNKGSTLMLTMMVIMLMATMAVGVLVVTGNALHMGKVRRFQSDAFNVAESGAEECALWFRNQSSPPTNTASWDPNNGSQTRENGSFRITVYPDVNNNVNFLKSYRIVSAGTAGGVTKSVEIVLRQATFGRFAYFTDKETSSISGGAIWWKTGEICDGPAHSNNTSGSNFQINYTGSTAPIFRDILTGAGTSINYSPSTPNNEATYQKVYLNGSKGYKLGVPRIELPSSTTAQRDAAWGSSSGLPSTTGVYLRASSSGGIYVYGDCTMAFSAPSATTQRITIKQGSNTSTVDVDLAAQTSKMTKPDGTIVNGGPVNGVIYTTGAITSLSGTIADNVVSNGDVTTRSAWTVATDVNNGKDITLTNNLVYRTKPDKTKPSSDAVNLAAGTLGLVGDDVVVSSSAPQNMEIDAVTMAGSRTTTAGSFYAQNYDSRTPVGTLKVIGGIIQKARGPVGTFSGSSTVTGYSKNYSYDPRLATFPPPFYPTTGTYERLSWRSVIN